MKRTALTLILIVTFSTLVVIGAQHIEFGRADAVQVQTVQSSTLEPQFDVDLVYAYVQGGSYGTVVFNVTRVSDLPLSSESTTEVYKVEIFSDGQLIGSEAVGWSIGKSMSMDIAMGFTMSLHSFYTSKIYGLQRVSIFFEPLNPNLVEPISLSIKRLGWITVDGDSVRSNLLGDEIIQQFQLEKFENGFLYTKPISLSKTYLITRTSKLRVFPNNMGYSYHWNRCYGWNSPSDFFQKDQEDKW